jgi:hypothetical protein
MTKFFVETQQIFGAKSAVPNFDRLGHTIFVLVIAKCKVQRDFIHRTLDDVPIISPKNVNWGTIFVNAYVEFCKELGTDVTTSCPKNEKAFVDSTRGKVLGIWFDTEMFCWKLPQEKTQKTAQCIKDALTGELDLKSFQSLMGRLNFAGQLCPFIQGFRFNLNRTLGRLQNGEKISLGKEARKDLLVWVNFILDENPWHPIQLEHFNPPLVYDKFISDAAGCSESSQENILLGCGNIGVDINNETFFASQLFWPPGVLQTTRDSEGKLYGQKTTTLEFLGILVPFMLIPERMVNSYVVVAVDNTSCYYGWLNRQAPGDESASVLIRTLHLLCSALQCEVHIEHLPRVSTKEAEIVERMSRETTTTPEDRALLRRCQAGIFPRSILSWMKQPWADWSLPERVLNGSPGEGAIMNGL